MFSGPLHFALYSTPIIERKVEIYEYNDNKNFNK